MLNLEKWETKRWDKQILDSCVCMRNFGCEADDHSEHTIQKKKNEITESAASKQKAWKRKLISIILIAINTLVGMPLRIQAVPEDVFFFSCQ